MPSGGGLAAAAAAASSSDRIPFLARRAAECFLLPPSVILLYLAAFLLLLYSQNLRYAENGGAPVLHVEDRPVPINPSPNQFSRNFRSIGVSTFTQYNAFRLSPTLFRIIGIGIFDWNPKKEELKCYWIEKYSSNGEVKDRIIKGKLSYFRDRQSHQYFTSYLYECYLTRATSDSGGKLIAKIDFFEKEVYWEEPKSPLIPPIVLNYTYCLAPMHGSLDEEMIVQWIEYHRVLMKAERFVFYNIDSVNDAMRSAFGPYIQSGMLQLIEFIDVLPFKLWYYGQVLASWDCTFSALDSRWVFLHDLDEYLYFVPPYSIDSVLTEHANKSWISHGMHEWNIKLCDFQSTGIQKNNKTLAIEYMVYYDPLLFCDLGKKLRFKCPNYHGHRKLIVNPRKVGAIETHKVVTGSGEGQFFWGDDVVYHNHYRLLILKQLQNQRCSFNLTSQNSTYSRWKRNESMKILAKDIHSCPLSSIPCM